MKRSVILRIVEGAAYGIAIGCIFELSFLQYLQVNSTHLVTLVSSFISRMQT